MKTVYIGKEGSGKTYLMGRDTEDAILRNEKLHKRMLGLWETRKVALEKHIALIEKTGGDTSEVLGELHTHLKRVPEPRPVVSNIAYSKSLEKTAADHGIKIRYWKDIEELEKLSECDLFIDEVGAYFDSRTYADLPLTTRLWLAQAQKLGVRIYGGAQDWGQIDVSFRRLVNRLYELKKVIGTRRPSQTIPAGKYPWAILFAYKVAPAASSDSTELRTLSILPEIHFAGKRSFQRFDTNARIQDSEYPPLKRIVRHWYKPDGKIGHTRIQYR